MQQNQNLAEFLLKSGIRYYILQNNMSALNWLKDEKSKASTVRPQSEIDKMYDMNFITEETNYVYANKPHKKDPKFFKKVKISILALIKMLNHTLMGGNMEVMGVLQGYYNRHGEFFIMNSLALPVEATETRVNAGSEADNFIIQYSELVEKQGGFGNMGWYHSHPTYGCWLSGIDVSTQNTYQAMNDPWLAVVIDPIRTITRQKIEIGAFRTVPAGVIDHKDSQEYGSDIPMKKIEDFGIHYNKYYQLEIEFIHNDIDNEVIQKLMKQFWVNHMASSPYFSNINYYNENEDEIRKCGGHICKREQITHLESIKHKEGAMKKMLKLTLEKNQALLGEAIKNILF